MANIHIARGETKLGNFPEEEVREGLRTGRFTPADLGWREGMTSWLPLAQFPEFAGADSPASAPGAVPPPGAMPGTVAIAAATGLPWDRRQELGLFPAFLETLKLVLLNPSVAFSAMKPEGGLGEPLIYALIGGSVGCIFYFLFSIFMSSFGILSDRNALAGIMGLGIGAIFVFLFIPVFVALGLFIGSAIIHLCLTVVGGARRTFETTFRVVCFSAGSTYPLMIVPICGGLIAGIWCLVVECIGLARAHQTTAGRAALAIFLPLIVCCGGGFVLGIMFGVLGALTGHHQ
jgi:hypothetical protein